jgi:hypothetical protein
VQDESTPKRPLSGFQRRKQRVEAGLPRYTERERSQRREDAARRRRINIKDRYAEFARRLNAIKMDRGCADCGYRSHPAALDFDHLPGFEKRFGLARAAWFKWDDVLMEIAKCEVVCANCHRIRTAERSGHTRRSRQV